MVKNKYTCCECGKTLSARNVAPLEFEGMYICHECSNCINKNFHNFWSDDVMELHEELKNNLIKFDEQIEIIEKTLKQIIRKKGTAEVSRFLVENTDLRGMSKQRLHDFITGRQKWSWEKIYHVADEFLSVYMAIFKEE